MTAPSRNPLGPPSRIGTSIIPRAFIVTMALAAAVNLGGCATVQPWERGTLARPEMQLEPDQLQTGLYQQVYDSKEASSGGAGPAGAGCGCN